MRTFCWCWTFSFGKCSAKQNVTNAFDAKMHLMQKCIWCKNAFDATLTFCLQNVRKRQNAFLQRITFYEVKCSASHFPLENVQHQMHFCIKCIWCKNAFLQRTAFVFCKAKNTAFCRFLTFWFAEHFPLENVMLNIFLWKMWCWTFYFVKCDALQKCIFASNAFDAKMHFCNAQRCVALPKCILPLSNIL